MIRSVKTIINPTHVGTNPTALLRATQSPKRKIRMGSWNICSLMKTGNQTLLANEAKKGKIDILCLQETRIPGSEERKIGDYTLINSGLPKGGSQGVGFLISTSIYKCVTEWSAVNERIITVRILLNNRKYMTVINIYAPTNVKIHQRDTESFYDKLQETVNKIKRHDTLIIAGDFNAQVGQESDLWPCLGKFGNGKSNWNGQRLLEFSVANGMKIMNTVFRHKKIHKHTFRSNTGKYTAELDHMLCRNENKGLFNDVRVYRGYEFNTDHYLVVATIRITTRKWYKNKKSGVHKWNTAALQDASTKMEYKKMLNEKYIAHQTHDSANSTAADWSTFRKSLIETADKCLGHVKTQRKPWISLETLKLIEQKRNTRIKVEELAKGTTRGAKAKWEIAKNEWKALRKQTVASCKLDKNKWWLNKALEIETAFAQNDQRTAYKEINNIRRGFKPIGVVKDQAGKMVNDKNIQLTVWKNHFENLLNPVEDNQNFNAPPTEPTMGFINGPIRIEEVEKAIQKLKDNKAAGTCGIVAELIKGDIETNGKWITELFNSVWKSGIIPEEWKQGIIIPIFKKGDPSDCNNYRGISLLSIVGKLFASVLLQRINIRLHHKWNDTQCGFRPERSTIDNIFTLRQIIEKTHQYNQDCVMAFIDFKQAFDSLTRKSLWTLLSHYGVEQNIIKLIQNLYEDSSSSVRIHGNLTDFFNINCGVRQGCTLSPVLFNIAIDYLVKKINTKNIGGIKLQDLIIKSLEYADDLVVFAKDAAQLQKLVTLISTEAKPLGLKINIEKTMTMAVQHSNRKLPNISSKIKLHGQKIKEVSHFTYLGSIIANNAACDVEITHRIGLAAATFGNLQTAVWSNKHLMQSTKIKVFKTTVIPTLLYGSETWTIRKQEQRKIDSFATRSLKKIMGIKWWHRWRNKDVWVISEEKPPTEVILQNRLRWFGHIERMDNTRIVRQVYKRQGDGKRSRGRPKKKWIDNLQEDLIFTNYDIPTAIERCQIRMGWRHIVLDAAKLYHQQYTL